MEEIEHYQDNDGDLPVESNSNLHQSSTNAGPSTSNTQFVRSNLVLHISVKRLKLLARQFYLSTAIVKLGPMTDHGGLLLGNHSRRSFLSSSPIPC